MNAISRITVILGGSILFSAASASALDSDLLTGMEARNIGPAGMSGRVSAVASVTSNPKLIVVGAASGGVWRSDNGGITWNALFDDQPVNSIGAIAINQSYPDVIWVGTGEGATRNSTSIGDGLYRSTDGGRTWVKSGLEGTERINRIALHPTDPETAYVSALGPLWNDGGDRGVFKTTDGGKTWTPLLTGPNGRTGATDVKIDPSNPNKLFASLWQFRRWPYRFESGGPGSGLYYSLNAGESWTQLSAEDGIPEGDLGRSIFAIAPSDPSRVYALVEAKDSALIRSDDGGMSWKTVNDETNITIRPFYYTLLDVDPKDPDTVYNVESRVRRSIDGGKTFNYIEAIDCCAPGETVHIDTHAWWINPNDPSHMISGNDGGIAITRDAGDTWRFIENLPLAQFYHIAVDNAHPYHVYGGLQDNGSWRGDAETFDVGGIRTLHWREVGFGDGFDTVPDPEIPDTGYAMSQGGNLSRWNLNNGEQRLIRPSPPTLDTDLRFNWSAGFAIDPFDPATIYYGSQFLHKSTDRGLSWTVISDDLTTNNSEWQSFRTSGGITLDVTAAENYTTIIAVAPSKVTEGVIWVGTDDGRIHVTKDGGKSWRSVEDRVRGVPEHTWVPMIYPSPHDEDVAYVVFDNHRRGDFTPYVYRADNFGQKWTRLSDDKLKGYALSVLQDPQDPELLWLGTEFGLFLSLNGGDGWTKYTAGVPTASVMDLAFQERENDLVVGTHGRGIYVIDDISPLRGLSADDFDRRFALLGATVGQQYDSNPIIGSRFLGNGEYVAKNEDYGVVLTFMASGGDLTHPDARKEKQRSIGLRADKAKSAEDAGDEKSPDPRATITVKDSNGEHIRSFSTDVHQGINRVTWNLKRDGLPRLPGDKKKSDVDLPSGIEVLPGTYTFTVSFDDQSESLEAEVLADPRVSVSLAAMQANQDMQLQLQELQGTINNALSQIITARRDLGTIETLLAQAPDAQKYVGLKEQVKTSLKALTSLEATLRNPKANKGRPYVDEMAENTLRRAKSFLTSTYEAPSPTALVFAQLAEARVESTVSAINDYLTGDFEVLRTAFKESGLGLLRQGPVDVGETD
ncbi:sialidase [Congregibacter brevis]|uniref:Sialidase n=1 Tax=Congregibacter brevis TaxID=3081201 RepID=A0ABZ0IHL8_9GAMM|nr:sialidase [Congregibacter sp. IMCC45268]